MILPFSQEQARALVNLRQQYEVWMAAERGLAALPYDLRRKEIGGRSYLYEISDRSGNGRSLGPWTEAQAQRLESYRAEKAALKARRSNARAALEESARICRSLRTPMIASEAGEVLREADRRQLLGTRLLVIGTNAIAAYCLEAGGLILDAPSETQDFDLAWTSETQPVQAEVVWNLLKAVDPTYTVNTERTFQARNAKAYEIELLVAPSRAATLAAREKPRPVPLPEQEWLLEGRWVDQVVIGRDAAPARILAPDPRWYALHKLWMGAQAKRNPLKRSKDQRQGQALLNAVAMEMPQFPLDKDFEAQLPDALSPFYAEWARGRPARPPSRW
jgi:hypothetical protein